MGRRRNFKEKVLSDADISKTLKAGDIEQVFDSAPPARKRRPNLPESICNEESHRYRDFETDGSRSSGHDHSTQPASIGLSDITDVRQGKIFNVVLKDGSRDQVERLAKEVLTNPVIEEYRIVWE